VYHRVTITQWLWLITLYGTLSKILFWIAET
jgi:hypothetical protein